MAGQRHHVVSVSAEKHAVTSSTLIIEGHRHEGAKTGGIEHASLADDLVRREAADLPGKVDHGVKGVGDNDEDGVRAAGGRPAR